MLCPLRIQAVNHGLPLTLTIRKSISPRDRPGRRYDQQTYRLGPILLVLLKPGAPHLTYTRTTTKPEGAPFLAFFARSGAFASSRPNLHL